MACRLAALTFLFGFLFSNLGQTLPAQDEVKAPPESSVEMLTVKVTVLDDEDLSIEGATVTVEGPLSDRLPKWIGWPENFGPPSISMTDQQGVAEVHYPKFCEANFETNKLRLVVNHINFVRYNDILDFDGNMTVRLEPGMRVIVKDAESDSGKKINSDLFAVMSGYGTEQWKYSKGMLISPTYSQVERQVRVVKIVPGEPTLFSDNIVLEAKNRHLLRGVKLSKGTRVEGKISDEIPRPIVNGHVSACVVTLYNGKTANHEQKWIWGERAPINADGTFVFPSLPRGELLQMIAVCDGYTAKMPTRKAVEEFFPAKVNLLHRDRTMPHLVLLEGDLVETEIRMQKAASVRIKFLTEDGNPIRDVRVSPNPNQEFFTYGTQTLGGCTESARELTRHRNGDKSPEWVNPFQAISNEDGIAVVRNMPPSRTITFKAEHPDYAIATEDGREAFTSKPEVVDLTITMRKRDSEN